MFVDVRSRTASLVLWTFALATLVHSQQVTVVFSGSIRGAALPVDINLNECNPTWATANDPTWPTCLGGAGRRAAFASNIMSSNPYTIVLDGGSAFWGGLMFQSTGNPSYMSELIALGQYHAIAVTEADLYNGPGPLGQYIRQVRAASLNYIPPFLCANVDVTRESALAGLILPSTIVTLNGTFKVGIFSMIDPLSASQTSPGPNVFFNTMYGTNNTVPSAQIVAATVTTLLNQHCDMIIMMTNVQVDRIMSLWPFPPRIDLILTTAYFNSNAPTTVSSYPYVWTTLQNAKIVIAGIRDVHGSSVSVTNISFSGNRVNVSSVVSALVPLTTATQTPAEGSPVAIGKMKNLYSLLQAAAGESKAYTAVSVMGQSGTWATQGCRYTDCQMGRLITDSVLHWCQTCDVALVNAGSIRASFNPGNISFLSIAAAFPYAGAFSTFQTTGSTLLAALQNMASLGVNRGSYLQVGGMRFAWNPNMSSTPSLAILEVEIWDKAQAAFKKLVLSQIYKVATIMYYRTGGDGYTMFADPKQVFNPVDSGPTDQLLIVNYLSRFQDASNPIPVIPSSDLETCYTSASIPLRFGAGPCRIVSTSGSNDLSKQCPSNANLCNSLVSQFGDGVPSTLEGIVANSSFCTRCSGLGSCADQKCTCQQPTTGLFAGMSMVSGADCGTVRRVLNLSPGYTGFIYFLGVFGLLVAVGMAATLAVLRSHPAIASTSPVFGITTCVGAFLASAAVIVLVQRMTDSLCQWWLWLSSLGFSLVFAAIMVRTYRIHMIFNSETGSVVISNLQLGLIIFGIVLLDLGVLLWWYFTAPYQAAGLLLPDASSAMVVCSSSAVSMIGAVLFLTKFGLLLACVYYAYSVRNVQGNWNESHSIALTIYNATAAFAILVPIMFFVQASSPELIEMLKAVLACYVSVGTVIGLYISRFYALLRGREFRTSDELLQQGSDQAQTSKLPSSQSHAHAEREGLIATRTQLRSQIAELRSRLQKIGLPSEVSTSDQVKDTEDPIAQFVSDGESGPSNFTSIERSDQVMVSSDEIAVEVPVHID